MSVHGRTRVILAADENGGVPPQFKKAAPFDADLKRKIPDKHSFDPKSLKPLSKMLWATSVALGHALTAHRQFSRLKSVSFSPDGLVGGQGYVMKVKDVRSRLFEACEQLSAICDTIHDEIHAPHWKPKMAELAEVDKEEVEGLLGDAEDFMEDPEGEAEEDMEEVEASPKGKKRFQKHEDESASQLPSSGSVPEQGQHPADSHRPELTKQASTRYSYDRTANSSEPVNTLPGPRVNHLGPAEGTGPFGGFNQEEDYGDDEWSLTEGVGNEYVYQSEWDNETPRTGASGMPVDTTPTEGYDFGIGYGGGDQANGQGAGGYGESNPSSGGKGVYGPRAELPSDPGGKTRDLENSGTNEQVEQKVVDMGVPAAVPGAATASAMMPTDIQPPVARSDYYTGPKGNDFNGVARYGESTMPGDDQGSYNSDRDLPNAGYRYERPAVPYVKWDDTTHNMRPDGYSQPLGPTEGPYVKQG
jgi:hypothetical protein